MTTVLSVGVAALAAAVVAGAIAYMLVRRQERAVTRQDEQWRQLLADMRDRADAERDAALSAAVERLSELAGERLATHMTRGAGDLARSKALIDQQLEAMRGELEKVSGLVSDAERERASHYGRLAEQLRQAGQQTAQLAETTRSLREALSSTKARGQWGERMAEDVLRLAGFVEGVQYRKQTGISGGGIPDFAFLLPDDREVRMDVKFPLDNYLRYLEADADTEQEQLRKAFLRDVRARVRELAGRDYIDPATTVDCVLLFIPNEQLYAFVQEQDAALLDEALRRKVVLCSPMTLFAVLAVIRQSIDTFRLAQTSDEILALLGDFRRQWERFTEQSDKLGRSLETAQRAYDELVGTRRRQLERPLDKLDAIRAERGVAVDGDQGDVTPLTRPASRRAVASGGA